MKKTPLRLKENVKAFQLKRKCILLETHLRFTLNVKAFCFKRFDVFIFYI